MLLYDMKIIVFAHHREVLDAIENFCASRNAKSIRIDG